MHAVVRSYSGPMAKELFDRLDANKADVESIIRGIPGFVAYSLVRTDSGGISVTFCQDKNGTHKSVRAAREWIEKNASDIKSPPPSISEGPVILQLSLCESRLPRLGSNGGPSILVHPVDTCFTDARLRAHCLASDQVTLAEAVDPISDRAK